jgi:hypothetical protein
MFWIGLFITFSVNLLSLGPLRRFLKNKFDKINDDHIDSFKFMVVLFGILISIAGYFKQVESNKKLLSQIKNTEELAERYDFHPISEDLFQRVSNRLGSIPRKDQLKVTLRIASGDYKREKIADEVIQLLKSVNITATLGNSVFIIGPERPPIEIYLCRGDDESLVKELFNALKPIWNVRKFVTFYGGDLKPGEIQLVIYQTPNFLTNGVMEFKF